MKKSVLFRPQNRLVQFEGCPSVLELAIKERLPLNHSCGGMGTCGTCRVVVESDLGSLPERGEIEKEMADAREFSQSERLACQIEAYDCLIVKIPG